MLQTSPCQKANHLQPYQSSTRRCNPRNRTIIESLISKQRAQSQQAYCAIDSIMGYHENHSSAPLVARYRLHLEALAPLPKLMNYAQMGLLKVGLEKMGLEWRTCVYGVVTHGFEGDKQKGLNHELVIAWVNRGLQG